MKLYYSEGACSLAPHIVLEELGLPYEGIALNMQKGEGTTPEFLKLNPMSAVPTLLLDNGEPLTEGVAILQYLADLKPELGLAPPAGSMARVRLQEMLNFISTELHKTFGPLWAAHYYVADKSAQEELKKNVLESLGGNFSVLEQKIVDRTFILGNQYSVADAYFFTVFNWCNYLGIKQDAWPVLKALSERIAARPAVQRTLKIEDLL